MASFAEFMAESYRSSVRLTWNLSSRRHATASFTVDTVKVIGSFEQREEGGSWHVVFEVDKGERTEVAYSAFAIFNGVFQAVREFVGVREPDTLVFATKRDELASIYQTYLRRESPTLEELGYRLEGPNRVEPYMEFVLKRTKPSSWRSEPRPSGSG
jgi:hypothetical protein